MIRRRYPIPDFGTDSESSPLDDESNGPDIAKSSPLDDESNGPDIARTVENTSTGGIEGNDLFTLDHEEENIICLLRKKFARIDQNWESKMENQKHELQEEKHKALQGLVDVNNVSSQIANAAWKDEKLELKNLLREAQKKVEAAKEEKAKVNFQSEQHNQIVEELKKENANLTKRLQQQQADHWQYQNQVQDTIVNLQQSKATLEKMLREEEEARASLVALLKTTIQAHDSDLKRKASALTDSTTHGAGPQSKRKKITAVQEGTTETFHANIQCIKKEKAEENALVLQGNQLRAAKEKVRQDLLNANNRIVQLEAALSMERRKWTTESQRSAALLQVLQKRKEEEEKLVESVKAQFGTERGTLMTIIKKLKEEKAELTTKLEVEQSQHSRTVLELQEAKADMEKRLDEETEVRARLVASLTMTIQAHGSDLKRKSTPLKMGVDSESGNVLASTSEVERPQKRVRMDTQEESQGRCDEEPVEERPVDSKMPA
ncbi:hypothetical protein CPC08DRAFT_818250 [Agrocybe pediades]|nr:hypothetical protein CPC08DRAFT_818250 [Agrocybe pediades]